MKRVLVTGAANIGKAGVATIVYKWGQQFDSNEIVYDYLMQSGLPDAEYVQAIKRKGGRIYTLKGKKSFLRIIRWVGLIIAKYSYDTIHINTDSAYVAAAYIYAAKKKGVKNILVHSHCTEIDDTNRLRRNIKTILHYLCIPYVNLNSKKYLACSKLAGNWMFGKKNVDSVLYSTVYNGVEVARYLYNQQARDVIRKALHIENRFVIGNIGRFSFQKNQDLLVDIFYHYTKHNPDAVLVLVGEGELMDAIRKKVHILKLDQKVLFLGRRNDIPQLLSAIDVMVMTSRFEGLPVTMVEAQMASLPCVVSAAITREAQFTKFVSYVEGIDVKEWISQIDQYCTRRRVYKESYLYSSDFNIANAAKKLEKILM